MIIADFLGKTVPELVGGDMRKMDASVLQRKADAN